MNIDLLNEKFLDKLVNTHISPVKVGNDFAKSFTEWYQALVRAATRKIEEWEDMLDFTHTCSSGCHYCCIRLVEVFNIETLAIFNYLESNKFNGFIEKSISVAKYIEEKLPSCPLNSGNGEAIINYKKRYILEKIPCIFLHDNKCIIYPVRPTNCVTYYSYGSKEDCYKPGPKSNLHMDFVERWMTGEIYNFLNFNKRKIPQHYLQLDNSKILTIAIRDEFARVDTRGNQ